MQYVHSICLYKLMTENSSPQLNRYSNFHLKYYLEWLLIANLGVWSFEVHYTEVQSKSVWHNVLFKLFPAWGKFQNNALQGFYRKSYFSSLICKLEVHFTISNSSIVCKCIPLHIFIIIFNDIQLPLLFLSWLLQSQNHRIEGLEGTSRGHRAQPPC